MEPELEPCCICGRPSVFYYDDRDDCPVCERPACAMEVQRGLDYQDEVGNR